MKIWRAPPAPIQTAGTPAHYGDRPSRFTALGRDGSILFGYLVATLVLLRAVIPQAFTAIPGGAVADTDGWQNVWNLWWLRAMLATNEPSLHTTLLFWPTGVDLTFQTLNLVTAVAMLPVQVVYGPIAAYNTAVLGGIVLSGYGAYRLAWAVLRQRAIAVVIGAIYTFSPFHLTKLWDGQLEWIMLQWLPFTVLAALTVLEQSRHVAAVLAGVGVALTALTSWYQALFVVIALGSMVLLWLPRAVRHGTWVRSTMGLIVLSVVAAAVLAPLVLPAVPDLTTAVAWNDSAVAHSADVLDFVLPSHLHPIWGATATRWHSAMRPDITGWTITPGITLLSLCGLGLVVAWRQIWRWAGLAAILCLLMLGPELTVAGTTTRVPLPYALLQALPGAALGRRPNHLMAVALLPIVLVAGAGMAWLLHRGSAGRTILVVLLTLLSLEYMVPPPPPIPFTADPMYRQLRDQPGALMELPIALESAEDLRHQLVHERPIVGGFVARTPAFAMGTFVPGIADLWAVHAPIEDSDILGAQPDLAVRALNYYQVTTLVIHRLRGTPETQRALEAKLETLLPGVSPQPVGPTRSVYQVPSSHHRDPFMYLTDGWEPLEWDGHRRWRWMGESATLALVNPTRDPQRIVLELEATSYDRPRHLTLLLDDQVLGTVLVTPRGSRLRVMTTLPPEAHQVRLLSNAEPLTHAGQRDVSVSFTRIRLLPVP